MWTNIIKLVVREAPNTANHLNILLTENPIAFRETTDLGSTPLHFACLRDETEITSILIQFGSDVNACNIYNETPLHWACKNGKLAFVTLLLAAGADVNMRDASDATPLDWAKEEENTEIINFLKPFQSKENRSPRSRRKNSGSSRIGSFFTNIVHGR